jgi:arylsulfatase A-like enzyme
VGVTWRRFALAVCLLLTAAACSETERPRGPNVVLVTLESLRTDHVGAYGGGSWSRADVPVTPAIDAFAARSTVYRDAHSVTSWTLAAHASLFTGLYPTGHQTDGPRDRLDDSYPTLAEALRRAGYQTAGVVSGPYLRRTHNLHQGFELWDDSAASLTNVLAHDDVTNPQMEQALRRFVDRDRDPERPFFLFAYFWDPHFDFLPPAPYDTMFVGPDAEPIDAREFDTNPAIQPGMAPEQLAWIEAQYAGEVRWTDEHVGRFIALLDERGLLDDTLVILTADHGEEFFDHGAKGHKNNLHAETVNVPLIVKYPGQREGVVDERLASLVDVVPTVLAVAGVSASFPVQGRSLLGPARARPVFFELLSVWYHQSPGGDRFASRSRRYGVRKGRHKLLWHDAEDGSASGQETLFDVNVDPGEREDIAPREPARGRELRGVFDAGMQEARRIARRYRRGGEAQLSPEEIERLRALGYLDS